MKSIRKYKSSDYKVLLEWYKERDNWHPPEEDMLPESSTFVLTLNDVPVAISSYYETNSTLAMLGATIKKKNGGADKEDIVNLIRAIKEDATGKGYKILFYATDDESSHMVRNFEKAGGTITDENNAWIASMSLGGTNIDWLKE